MRQKENGFKEYLKERNDFYKLVDVKDYQTGNFDASSTKKHNKVMFGYYAKDGDKLEFTQLDFANYIQNYKYRGNKSSPISIEAEINRIYKNLTNTNQISKQIYYPIVDQIRTQIWAQIDDQIRTQIWTQIYDQISPQIYDQIDDKISLQISTQIRTQIHDQIMTQIWN